MTFDRQNPPELTHAAIQYDGKIYKLPAPKRHPDVVRMIKDQNGVGIGGPDVKGFTDNSGNFYNRSTAYEIAVLSGQLNKESAATSGGLLYSEDIW
jgi:hypothetical protein